MAVDLRDPWASSAPIQLRDPWADDEPASPTLGDYGRSVMAGGAGVAEGAGWLLERLGADTVGGYLRDTSRNAVDYWRQGMTDAAKEEMSKQFVTQDEQGNYRLGDASWSTVGLAAAGSLLGTAAGMGAGAGLTKGFQLIPGLSKTVAGALGYGLGEAGVSAPSAAAGVGAEIDRMSDDQLSQHPEYQAALEGSGGDPVQARELVKRAAENDAGALSALTTFVLSAPMGTMIGKATAGIPLASTRPRSILSGAAGEAAQEFGQSGAEQFAQNLAIQQNADESRSLSDNVLNQAVGGAAAGGLMGGVFGAGSPLEPVERQAPPSAPPTAPVPPAVKDAGIIKSVMAAQSVDDAIQTAFQAADMPSLDEVEDLIEDRPARGEIPPEALRAPLDAASLSTRPDGPWAPRTEPVEPQGASFANLLPPLEAPAQEKEASQIAPPPSTDIRRVDGSMFSNERVLRASKSWRSLPESERSRYEIVQDEKGVFARRMPDDAPAKYDDDRLNDSGVRDRVQFFVRNGLLSERDGNMALVRDTNWIKGESDKGDEIPMIRSKSQNPTWFQSNGVTVDQARDVVRRANAGERLGATDKRTLSWLIDNIEYEEETERYGSALESDEADASPFLSDEDRADQGEDDDPTEAERILAALTVEGYSEGLDAADFDRVYNDADGDADYARKLRQYIQEFKATGEDARRAETRRQHAESEAGEAREAIPGWDDDAPRGSSEWPGEEPEKPAPVLTTYSDADLRKRDKQAQAAVRAEQDAEAKRLADEQRSSFTLTGSNRVADVGAARGQNDLFGASQRRAPETKSDVATFRTERGTYLEKRNTVDAAVREEVKSLPAGEFRKVQIDREEHDGSVTPLYHALVSNGDGTFEHVSKDYPEMREPLSDDDVRAMYGERQARNAETRNKVAAVTEERKTQIAAKGIRRGTQWQDAKAYVQGKPGLTNYNTARVVDVADDGMVTVEVWQKGGSKRTITTTPDSRLFDNYPATAPRPSTESAESIAGRVEDVARDLAQTTHEETRLSDFAPNDLPKALRMHAEDYNVPLDDLRHAFIQKINKSEISDARKVQIRKALSVTDPKSAWSKMQKARDQERAAKPEAVAPAQYAGPQDVSSRAGQMELANRGATIAALKGMNEQIRKIAPDEAWADENIEQSDNLDALRTRISQTLVDVQRGRQSAEPSDLRSRLQEMSGQELQGVFDTMGLAGRRMTHAEKVDALMAENEADVRAALPSAAPNTTEPETAQEPAPKPVSEMSAADLLRAAADKMEGKAESAPTQATATADDPIATHSALWRRVMAGEASPEEFKEGYRSWVDNKEAIMAAYSAMTKAKLLEEGGGFFAARYRNDAKPTVVEARWRNELSGFSLGRSIQYGMEKGGYERAVGAMVEATGKDELQRFADERKAATEEARERASRIIEGIKNPQTLDDFRSLVRAQMQEGKSFAEARMSLAPEQRARFDSLTAEQTRGGRVEKKDDRGEIRIAGQNVDAAIIETKHTQKGHDLFVVRLAERVSREDYETLNASAKKIGGYYSSYRGHGAIAGFQFRDRATAEAFVKLANGDGAQAQEAADARRDAFEDDRSQSAVERLIEMADRLEERADESLAVQRKANTERRARMAAGAEASARADKALAGTMRNIARAIENGSAKFLDRVRQKKQVELLAQYVATAKYNEIRAKHDSYGEQEKRRGEPPTIETADYAEFPSFTAYRSDLATLARQMLDVEGTKKLGGQLLKVADDVSDAFTKFAKTPGNLFSLSAFSVRSGDDIKTAIFASKETAERAISRSGLTGRAIVFPEKRGVNRIIMSPSEAISRGIWKGDGDKRITLTREFGKELLAAIGKRANKANGLSAPWQFETANDRLNALERMGIETPAEFRAALREYIGLQERVVANRARELELAMAGRKNDGLDFFPTPADIADQMVEAADIQPDMAVLEPSAGMGHIADRIRAAGAEPDVIELNADRRELLQEKGYHLAESNDFLRMEPRSFYTYGDIFRAPDGTEGIMRGVGHMGSQRVRLEDESGKRLGLYDRSELTGVAHRGSWSGYDRIIMNPPFGNRRDAEHVRHAYNLLRPGGRIVAIMGEGVFFGQDKKAEDFREWLESVNGTSEKLAEGTFLDPSLPVNTGVNARMVVIDKPARESADAPAFSRRSVTNTPAFRRWFGDSKVVDENGEPLVVYHGTVAGDGLEFADRGRGIFFTDSARIANGYTSSRFMRGGTSPAVVPAYLSMQNPLIIDAMGKRHDNIPVPWQQWKAKVFGKLPSDAVSVERAFRHAIEHGHDGLIVRNVVDTLDHDDRTKGTVYAVARPEQIKSATGNRGTFDPDDPNILLARGQKPAAATPTLPVDAVERIAQGVVKRMKLDGITLNVAATEADLPQEIQDQAEKDGATGDIDGVYHRGVLHIVAGGIRSESDVARIVAHEGLGHFGAEKFFGPDIYPAFKQLFGLLGGAQGMASRLSKVGINFDPYIKTAAEMPVSHQHWYLTNEFLAHMQQTTAEESLPQTIRRKAKELYGKLREFFRNLFGTAVADFTDSDLYALLAGMRSAAAGGGKAGSGSAVFVRAPEAFPIWQSALKQRISEQAAKVRTGNEWGQWLAANTSKLGIKKDEIEWSGITDYLAMRGKEKVSGSDIADWLDQNGVRVEEAELGARPDWRQRMDMLETRGFANLAYREQDELMRLRERFDEEGPSPVAESSETKFDQYQLPGGENYRELLLTLPLNVAFRVEQNGRLWGVFNDAGLLKAYERRDHAEAFASSMNAAHESNREAFRSSHFPQPNILAHVRFNERTDADGRRVLFIEEIQSDFAQAGRKQGFRPTPAEERAIKEEFDAADAGRKSASPDNQAEADARYIRALDAYNSRINDAGVPRAPFVTDTKAWTALALKRMVRYAVDNGFDAVAWANGEQQADRYSLAKQVDSVRITRVGANEFDVVASVKGGGRGISETGLSLARVEETVGKDLAKRAEKLPEGVGETYTDADLKVGGEGMRAFYDGIVPQVANDLLKKLGGGRVDSLMMKFDNAPEDVVEATAQRDPNHPFVRKNRSPQPGFAITDRMREIASRGMPLFSKRPASAEEVFAQWQRKLALMLRPGTTDDFVAEVPAPLVLRELGVLQKVSLTKKRMATIRSRHPDVPASVYVYLPSLLADPSVVYVRTAQQASDTNAVIEVLTQEGEPILVGMRDGEIKTITPKHHAENASGPDRLAREIRGSKVIYARDAKALDNARAFGVAAVERGTIPQSLAASGQGHGSKVLFRADVVKKHGRTDDGGALFSRGNQPRQQSPLIPPTPPPPPPSQGAMPVQGQPGNGASWDAPAPSFLDSVIQKIQDKHIDLKRVQESIRQAGGQIREAFNAYQKEELYHGRAAERINAFIESELDPLITQMRIRKVSQEELGRYLWARHAPEANAHIAKINPDLPDGGSGMTNAEAAAYMAGLTPEQKRAYSALASMVDGITQRTRQTLFDYGLISDDTKAEWEKYQYYVPLNREDMDHLLQGSGTGMGFSIRGPEAKRRVGSELPVVDILGNIANQRDKAVVRGEKNRVGLALYGLARTNPNPDFWKVDRPPKEKIVQTMPDGSEQVVERVDPLYKSKDNVVVVKIRGKNGSVTEHSIVFSERNERAMRMAAAIKNLDGNEMGELLSAAAKVTRYFAAINTQYNPIFGVVNLTRDVQTAGLNLSSTPLAGKQAQVMGDAMKIIAGAASTGFRRFSGPWANMADEFGMAGGKTGYREMFKTGAERTEAIEKALDPDWWTKRPWGKVLTANGYLESPATMLVDKGLRPMLDWLSDYNYLMENAVRLATYKAGMDSGLSKDAAASLAKNISVNFNRRGADGTQINALYAFFNASAQGTARMVQTLKGPAGKYIIGGGVLLGVMQAVLLAAAGFDEDEPPDFVRERNLIIPIGDKKYVTIPYPLGFHALPNLGRLATEAALFGDVDKRIHQMFGVIADAFNPLGGSAPMAQIISPTVTDPLVALGMNQDWTGKPIAREDFSSLRPTPGFTRARDAASYPARWAAEAINTLSGGSKYKPGIMSPTPDQIEYLVGQVTGGVGREAGKLATTLTTLASGEDLPTYKIPLVGRFYGSSEGQAPQANKFYNNVREINVHAATVKGLREDKRGAEALEYVRENPTAKLYQASNKIQRRVQLLRRRRSMLIEQDAPKAKIREIDDQLTALMAMFNEQVELAEQRP